MATTYGTTGKILKIDLASQKAELLETAAYGSLAGGPALAYRLLAEFLPASLEDAYDENNLIVLAAGPLTGSGLPGACAAVVGGISPLTGTPATAFLGGRFACQLKYAGYDAVVITGRASVPVWVNIRDNQVKLESASFLWGMGTRNAAAQICSVAGGGAATAVIGPAGENQVPLASVVSTGAFSAGGFGGVFGSKNLKAIAVQGSGAVQAADAQALWSRADEICRQYVAVRGGYVVPAKAQTWSDYANSHSYWNASASLGWGGSEAPACDCPPGEASLMGRRTLAAARDFGEDAARYITRNIACPSCPVGCLSALRLPDLEALGLAPYVLADPDSLLAAAALLPEPETAADTPENSESSSSTGSSSAAASSSSAAAEEGPPSDILQPEYDRLLVAAAGASLADDFGVWLADGQLARDFRYAVESGALETALGQTEYTSLDWDQYQAGNPAFLNDFFRRIAQGIGELAHLGDGSAALAERWKFGDGYFSSGAAPLGWGSRGLLPGRSLHGAGETALAALSPDELRRPLAHLLDCGLPLETVRTLLGRVSGSTGFALTRTPGQESLFETPGGDGAIPAWSALAAMQTANLGLCPHLWPMSASPLADQNYAGDPALEAELLALVSGEAVTAGQLQQEARAAMALQRGLAAIQLDSQDLAQTHDLDESRRKAWEAAGGEAAVTQALIALYEQLGWDQATGLPTAQTLSALGLNDLAAALREAFTAVV